MSLFHSRKPVEGLRNSFCALCPPVVKSNIFISEPALASRIVPKPDGMAEDDEIILSVTLYSKKGKL